MKPYLSIVIPYYNSADTIGTLLTSIARSRNAPPYEVIVVDDGSVPKFEIRNMKSEPYGKSTSGLISRRKFPLRSLRLNHNMGPAAARNRGVKAARGKFVVFLDSDVELFPDTLHNLARVFITDPDVVALTGVWVKEQRTGDFFPNFKALRDWSYWINERDKSGYYYLFSTRIASIKRSVFTRLGGFDEKYPGALVEDIELTYRIARRYAIIFASDVRVRHEFEGFWPIARKYFLRAYHWTKLYARRKKFDPVATTLWEAIAALSGAGTLAVGLIWIMSLITVTLGIMNYDLRITNILLRSPLFVLLNSFFVILLSVHLFLVRKFLIFMYREKGGWFAVRGFVVGLILYLFIFSGAVWGRVSQRIIKLQMSPR
ncbi:hypothetical protein A2Z33_04245 [Candidatus Gottesmanbacteria bacterium RBG_16_52_11]|uniref:Glycosyltransferase 2-like domain-containing protein n=1 Tax=Candidatus Gottesmanbacteria bacterium RBG_16_52_11 TaxID=1798374 RepID=A0A1F5YVW5_9BACT|nr:MAG: hypothetical protein A2Z33_04245 [Candidatus Gottesmanbacteria bacterium RBG_16_52_11]